MAVFWDSTLVAGVAAELDRTLRGDRLRAVHLEREARAALLFFRHHTLVLRLRPEEGHLILSGAEEPFPSARELAAEVVGVEAPLDDRVILLRLRRPRGRKRPLLVAIELITNRWNVIVSDGEHSRIRHVLRAGSGPRPMGPGQPYELPPASERVGLDGELSRAEWAELLPAGSPADRRRSLLSTLAWTSALNVGPLLDGIDPGEEEPPSAATDSYQLWTRLAERGVPSSPVSLRRERGLQPYPMALPGVEGEPIPSLLEGLARAAGSEAGATLIPAAWLALLEDRARSREKRVRSLQRELDEAPDPEPLRASGNLILARLREIRRGASRVTLTGFDGEPTELELDPARAPQENAADYYERAARAERARERLPGLLAAAREAEGESAALLRAIEEGSVDCEAVRAKLPQGLPEPRGKPGPPSLPYRLYRSSGGIEIRVGRGDRRNDDLTFRYSHPEDIWLHARHAAGAHVILRWNREGNPPGRDLSEAAILAALHSRARFSGMVPVDWTRRKYVRKPKKASPGTVLPDRIQTVFVEPDPALESRLRHDP